MFRIHPSCHFYIFFFLDKKKFLTLHHKSGYLAILKSPFHACDYSSTDLHILFCFPKHIFHGLESDLHRNHLNILIHLQISQFLYHAFFHPHKIPHKMIHLNLFFIICSMLYQQKILCHFHAIYHLSRSLHTSF